VFNILDIIRKKLKTYLKFIFVFIFLLGYEASGTENKTKIIATVNGFPITSYDLNSRLNIFLFESNLENNYENKNKFTENIIDNLIEEELKFQEAKKINPNIIFQAEKKAVELIEKNFGDNLETININLKPFGASYNHFLRLFTADVIWSSIIKSKYENEFINVKEKVQNKLNKNKLDLNKTHYKLSEIEVTPSFNRNIEASEKLLEDILISLRQGANFNSLAKQFSSSKTRNNNGMLGWIKEDTLSLPILNLLEKLEVGEISKVIKIGNSLKIFRLEGKIINGKRNENESIIELVKLVYPLEKNDETEILKSKKALNNDLIRISDCSDLKKLHLNYGNKKEAESGKFRIFDLKKNVKKEVIFLRKNQHTKPIFTNSGFVVLMVCDRYLPKISFQNEVSLRNDIESKLFVQLSDRYINRLKRSSYIEKNN
tara:strand:- start:446 stop:1735 length:1290 start_codon:yes stop_codon:yes gene_type:complete